MSYKFSGYIACNLDKNTPIVLNFVCFYFLVILEDIIKPSFKHFFSNDNLSSRLGNSVILYCLCLHLAHNQVVFNNLILSTDEYISMHDKSFTLPLFLNSVLLISKQVIRNAR